jgi:hypothetical protein
MKLPLNPMKLNSFCLAAAALAGGICLASAGDITGKVTLKGTPKPEIKIEMDPNCGKLSKGATTRHYVADASGGLANVFVYLKKDGLKAPPAGEAQILDQVDCMYEPYVMGVVTGQKFKIRNSDALLHNVHATPKPASGNPEFNFAQPVKGQVNEKQFDKPEVLVRIKCDVHPWMFGYVGAVEHPYFAVSGKDGTYKIANVPDGKYSIIAYHLKAHGAANPGVMKEIEVKGGTTADFVVEVPAQ